MRHRVEKWEPNRPVSDTCRVQYPGEAECGKPAVMAYPAMGGGYMELCAEHGEKHRDICVTIEQARRGEVSWIMQPRESK